MAEERKEEHQKCEELKEETLEINGHCQEDGVDVCSQEDTRVVDEERLAKFFRAALDASRRMNEEIKRSNDQREQLLGKFGAETVSQWMEEHHQLEFLNQLEPTSSS